MRGDDVECIPPRCDDIHLSNDGARMFVKLLAADIAPVNSED
jgi:hypothetical protein